MFKRFLNQIGYILLSAIIAASPVMAEAPDFPDITEPGEGPGFQSKKDTKEPTQSNEEETEDPEDSSTLGESLTHLTYGLAALLTLWSGKKFADGVVRTRQAVQDIVQRGSSSAEYEALIEQLDLIERDLPKEKKGIVAAQKKYLSELEKFNQFIKESSTNSQPTEALLKAMDSHLDQLLSLPLLKNRETKKAELNQLIDRFKDNRDNRPLSEWLAQNQDYDLIRTTKGREWEEQYIEKQKDLALTLWKEKGLTQPLQQWIDRYENHPRNQNPKTLKWIADYKEQQRNETAQAKQLSDSLKRSFEHLKGKLPAKTNIAEISFPERSPGQFAQPNGGRKILPQNIARYGKKQCEQIFKQLDSRRADLSQQRSYLRNSWRMVWPLVPATAGLGGGGYFTWQGIRYYTGNPVPGPDPGPEPKTEDDP